MMKKKECYCNECKDGACFHCIERAQKSIPIFVFGILIIIVIAMASCTTQRKCNRMYPPEVKTIIERHTETIIKDTLLPGATVYHTIQRDSLITMTVDKWTVIRDTSGLAELRLYRDAYGNLLAACEAKDRSVEKTKTIKKENSKKIEVKKNEINFWDKMLFFLSGVGLAGIVIAIRRWSRRD